MTLVKRSKLEKLESVFLSKEDKLIIEKALNNLRLQQNPNVASNNITIEKCLEVLSKIKE